MLDVDQAGALDPVYVSGVFTTLKQYANAFEEAEGGGGSKGGSGKADRMAGFDAGRARIETCRRRGDLVTLPVFISSLSQWVGAEPKLLKQLPVFMAALTVCRRSALERFAGWRRQEEVIYEKDRQTLCLRAANRPFSAYGSSLKMFSQTVHGPLSSSPPMLPTGPSSPSVKAPSFHLLKSQTSLSALSLPSPAHHGRAGESPVATPFKSFKGPSRLQASAMRPSSATSTPGAPRRRVSRPSNAAPPKRDLQASFSPPPASPPPTGLLQSPSGLFSPGGPAALHASQMSEKDLALERGVSFAGQLHLQTSSSHHTLGALGGKEEEGGDVEDDRMTAISRVSVASTAQGPLLIYGLPSFCQWHRPPKYLFPNDIRKVFTVPNTDQVGRICVVSLRGELLVTPIPTLGTPHCHDSPIDLSDLFERSSVSPSPAWNPFGQPGDANTEREGADEGARQNGKKAKSISTGTAVCNALFLPHVVHFQRYHKCATVPGDLKGFRGDFPDPIPRKEIPVPPQKPDWKGWGKAGFSRRREDLFRLVGLANVKVQLAAAGGDHLIFSTTSGELYAWGQNHMGQLGTRDFSNRKERVELLEVLPPRVMPLKVYVWGRFVEQQGAAARLALAEKMRREQEKKEAEEREKRALAEREKAERAGGSSKPLRSQPSAVTAAGEEASPPHRQSSASPLKRGTSSATVGTTTNGKGDAPTPDATGSRTPKGKKKDKHNAAGSGPIGEDDIFRNLMPVPTYVKDHLTPKRLGRVKPPEVRQYKPHQMAVSHAFVALYYPPVTPAS
uniref:Regulator of chromosome condensation (RCC1) repeat-containing protein n=1 Tax=Chromera velia CCMP2878 TaxID=1169474 RepID=A0A0G4GQP2_9ALVE|eukprot:Cvel_22946.t1-p1 / transcript=Cvel_22946.t1 / gene=Cvel_22946 / organism=Chromera_velia_CCMP2878 / gene_product=hypothetical protein / transcript_product=hypothetical protein / location=Cvel_scaffold2310:4176-14720(+) / protein_length=786 / sequence_SO=supercontig / SO=protein_coding / is_pseudo=false